MEYQTLGNTNIGSNVSRRTLLAGIVAAAMAPTIATAGAGAPMSSPRPKARPTTRRFWMKSIHTGEEIDKMYFFDGAYDANALRDIRYFLRDWRTGDVCDMDLRGIDLWAETHRLLDANRPFQLISGYRSPKTNRALSKNSSGVAKKSFHMRGMAADLRLPGRSLRQIARAASHCGAGGIGLYPASNFVHIDTGPVRQWKG